jgi:phosphate-selective porin OprO and OprP
VSGETGLEKKISQAAVPGNRRLAGKKWGDQEMKRSQFALVLGLSASLGWAIPGLSRPSLSEENSPTVAELQEQLRALEQRLQILEELLKSQSKNGIALTKEVDWQSTPSSVAAAPEEPRQKPTTPEAELKQEDPAAKKKEDSILTAAADGFSLRSGDGDFNLRVGAHFHADGRFFVDDTADVYASTLAIRRARLLFEGTLAKYFDFRFMPDFAGNRLVLQDVYLDARFVPQIRLRVGKFKTPFGLERLKQPVNISFVERALPNNLVPNRDLGIQVHGDFGDGVVNYMLGVFNGVPDGGSEDQDNQDSKDYAGRIFVQPFLKSEMPALRGLGVGMAATSGIHRGTTAAPSLPFYVTSGQLTFFNYRSDGSSAGNTIADGRLSRLSPQTYYHWGPFSLLGEYVTSSQAVRRAETWARLEQTASQIALTYVLTGEDSSYRAVVPKRSLDPRMRTWGAFELTGRYSELNVDKNAFPIFANPRTSARKAQAWAGGLNWYFNRNARFVVNYEQTFFKEGGFVGNRQTEKAIMTRFQLAY